MKLLLIFSILIVGSYSFTCPGSYNCTCVNHGVGYELACPQFSNSQVLVRYKSEVLVKIQCKIATQLDDFQNLLKGFEFGSVKNVIIMYCPVPGFSFKTLFDNMGIFDLKIFRFVSYRQTEFSKSNFESLDTLKNLDLSRNKLVDLNKEIFRGTKNLTTLSLRSNSLKFVEQQFIHLKGLKYLDIGDNKLEALSKDVFEGLNELKILNLDQNSFLSALPPNVFYHFSHLEHINLNMDRLTSLPEGIFDPLGNLQIISLSGNYFDEDSSIPDGLFKNNSNLQKIIWYNNYALSCAGKQQEECNSILHLPANMIQGLKNLEVIEFFNLGIKELPKEFFSGVTKLANLTIKAMPIDGSERRIRELTSDIFRDTKELKNLDMGGNDLRDLAADIFFGLGKLQKLRLHSNNLKEVKDEHFRDLRNLQILHIQSNKIEKMGEKSFDNTLNLRVLNASNNNLDTIFSKFNSYWSKVDLLEILDLSFNRINLHSFPNDLRFGKTHLSLLDLSHNLIGPILKANDLQFVGSKKLSLNLTHNALRTIDLSDTYFEDDAASKQEDHVILIGNNPLECDCNAFDLVSYAKGSLNSIVTKWFKLNVTNLRCYGPPKVANISIKEVDHSSLTCLQAQLCPKGCKCFTTKFYKETGIQCNNIGKLIPQNLPLYPHTDYINLEFEDNQINDICSSVNHNSELLKNVKMISFANNNLSRLNFDCLPKDLTKLDISYNNFKFLDEAETEFLRNIIKNGGENPRLNIGNNPYECDCTIRETYKFFQENYNKYNYGDVKIYCEDGPKSFHQVTFDEICISAISNEVVITVVILIAITIIAVLVAFYMCNRGKIIIWVYSKRWGRYFFSESDYDENKLYDAFISYSHHDEMFVEEQLIEKLEKEEPGYVCHYHTRDWNPGEMIQDQISHSVASSRRTILVLSKHFLESMWSMVEFKTAHMQALQDKTNRIILIVLDELPPRDEMDEILQNYISLNTYLLYDDPWFWEKLRYALPHKGKGGGRTYFRNRSRNNSDKVELMKSSGDQSNSKGDCRPMPSAPPPYTSLFSTEPSSGYVSNTEDMSILSCSENSSNDGCKSGGGTKKKSNSEEMVETCLTSSEKANGILCNRTNFVAPINGATNELC